AGADEAAGGGRGDGSLPVLHARPWPEAGKLFRRDRRWLGADDAHSVDLGSGRVLWLFGDTLIDPRAGASRRRAVMVRNSIGLQNGYDPTAAGMTFFWKTSANANPCAFFDASPGMWLWPADGVRLGQRLLIFLAVVRSDPNPLGFALSGWRAVMVDNPDAPPDRWRILPAATKPQRTAIILGTGGVLLADGYVYAYGSDASGSRVFVARWPAADVEKGNLDTAQWWHGRASGWLTAGQTDALPAVLFTNGQSEFGVYRDSHLDRYVQIQTMGFGAADLGFRTASRPEGPWTALSLFYRPPEKKIPGVLIYAAKPHDFLTSEGCIVTYATNHMNPQMLVDDPALYFPRVLRATWNVAHQPH
ncbi:MAG TPA: DUF4185 domain-containing protein, partial [Desulfosarcina sp.]|nr:DUF4185 domain-containing protein [Desulfosarcina sp.]